MMMMMAVCLLGSGRSWFLKSVRLLSLVTAYFLAQPSRMNQINIIKTEPGSARPKTRRCRQTNGVPMCPVPAAIQYTWLCELILSPSFTPAPSLSPALHHPSSPSRWSNYSPVSNKGTVPLYFPSCGAAWQKPKESSSLRAQAATSNSQVVCGQQEARCTVYLHNGAADILYVQSLIVSSLFMLIWQRTIVICILLIISFPTILKVVNANQP